MDNQERAECYIHAFPKFEPLYISKSGRIEGLWFMGNNYRTSGYYGAYPHGYLKRINALFPDIEQKDTIHICAGSLPEADYTRVDINPSLNPEICCNAEELAKHIYRKFKIAFVDVPYSEEDAVHYGTVMLSRKKVLSECWNILEDNGWVIWLDQVFPMYAKKNWSLELSIGMIKSTNHRVRAIFGFKKNKGEK